MVMSPQVSWLFFKAVRAGLAVKRPYLDPYGRASNAEKQSTGRARRIALKMGRLGETYRRIGVSACRRLQSIINSVETS